MTQRLEKMAAKVKLTEAASTSSLAFKLEATIDFSKMIAAALHPLVDQLTMLNQKFDTLRKELQETSAKTEKITKKLKKVDLKSKEFGQRLEVVEKDKISENHQLLLLQMEKSAYVLRFQSILEQKGEDLKEILSKELAPVVGLTVKVLQSDIDMIYRTYPEYIKKNKFPGEISIKFSKRSTRDLILKATSRNVLKIQGKQVKTLKDILFEIRKRRRQYRDLALFLQKHNTPYRWITLEGIIFNFNRKKEKIDSVLKAKKFLEQQQEDKDGPEKLEDDKDAEKEEDENEESSKNSSSAEYLDSKAELGAMAPKPPKNKREFEKKCKGRNKYNNVTLSDTYY